MDFDGVIHKYSKGWLDGSIYDEPMEGAKEQLAKIVKKGFRVVIMTTRLNHIENGQAEAEKQRKMMIEWFDKYGFEEGVHYHELTALKPQAGIYIDDRGMRFTNWVDVGKYFF